jgi:hypothetical protein
MKVLNVRPKTYGLVFCQFRQRETALLEICELLTGYCDGVCGGGKTLALDDE